MALHYQDAQVEIHRYVVGPIDNNVFVLRCKQTGEALLVDAANEHDQLLRCCQELGVRQVVETHGHWDHIQAVPALRDAGYSVAVTAADAGLLPSYDLVLEDDSVLTVGRVAVRTIATPGHTPGSMCFVIEGSPVVLSGDTLFPGGPGATEAPLGDFPTIMSSIERKLFAPLPAETIVMPGHGADTTIGAERPHFEEWLARGW
jgi:glyoxylase-like metal-dependent hydrolase (beta-lactamase superfamily II)